MLPLSVPNAFVQSLAAYGASEAAGKAARPLVVVAALVVNTALLATFRQTVLAWGTLAVATATQIGLAAPVLSILIPLNRREA